MSHRCFACGRTFGSQQALQQHLDSPAHNWECDECDRTFGSQQSLQQHLNSPAHNCECNECERTFGSQQALQQHQNSPAHSPKTCSPYLGIPSSVVTPVYAAAYHLRFRQPTVNDIVKQTKTNLNHTIVSTLIAAALRLLPIDNTAQGVGLRTEQHSIKRAASKNAEDTFCTELHLLGYTYLREDQQGGAAVTPDVRFQTPVYIGGHLYF